MDNRRLTKNARTLILNADEVFISSASIWEMAIKARLGKLEADVTLLISEIEASGFRALSISTAHAEKVRHLPDIHRDPFDRILIAQAQYEPLQLVTADERLAEY